MNRVETLRDILRRETRQLHDALDEFLGPLADGNDYPDFLATQYSARVPIEGWFRRESAVMHPPTQTGHISQDLAELNYGRPVNDLRFAPEESAEVLGIAWVLAGSSMGNRVILKRRIAFDGGKATRFLSDPSMTDFWSVLRPRLERETSRALADAAITGAVRTFDHFLANAQVASRKLAA